MNKYRACIIAIASGCKIIIGTLAAGRFECLLSPQHGVNGRIPFPNAPER